MRVAFKEYNEIMGQIDSSYHEAAVKMNMADSERDILYILQSYQGSCNQSVLYKESGLTKSTANTALKKMEKNGLILIQPADGRNTRVSVTDKGHELIKNTVGRIIEMENEIYDSWTDDEQKLFVKLTRDFSDKIRKKIEEL